MKKIKLGLVVSKFNYSITGKMEKISIAHAKKRGASVTSILYSPGTCDAPFVVNRMLKARKVDAIAVLGVVLKGATDHDQVVTYTAFNSIMSLSHKFDRPVTFGIIGPNATRRLAMQRADDYARRAVDAAVDLAAGKVVTVREHE